MSPQLSSAGIVISSIVMYQIFIKSIPEGLNPVHALVTFYLSALVCTLIASRFITADETYLTGNIISWQAVLVGVAIVGIELGYLLMYRSGWNLAIAPLIGTGCAVVLLALIGFTLFREPLSLKQLVGISSCLFGLYLLLPQE